MPWNKAQSDKRRKAYFAQQAVLQKVERDLIDFYEIQWFLRHTVPTIEELVNHLKKEHPKTNHISVNYYLNRKPVQVALTKRGIPWQEHTRNELTNDQVAAAITVMNFSDTRSNEDKLAQLGVNPAQYQAWLLNPQFKNLIDSLADQNLQNVRPTAVVEFTKLINKGDWQAIKYWLDTTGELKTSETPQMEVILKAVIEVIQTHVKDPATLANIATDLLKVTNNKTLAIEAEVVVDSEELAEAKKLMGYG